MDKEPDMAKSYIKPELPRLFVLMDERGWTDGPYKSAALEQSTEERQPWVIPTHGTPRFFRLTKQEDKTLFMDDGQYEIKVMIP